MSGHRRVGHRQDRPRRGAAPGRALVLALLTALACAGAAWGAPPPSILGEPPLGHGVLRFPQALAYSPGAQYVVVGDQFSSVVQVFDRGGTWQRDIAFHADAGQPGRIGVVGGLAVDRNGHVFVLDSANDRIQAFALADGRWLGAFGGRGTDPGRFRLGVNTGAGGLALTQPDAATAPVVYVADQYNHRIQRFTLAGVTPGGERVLPEGARDPADGRIVPVPSPDLPPWGHRGDCCTPDGFSYPQGLAVDARLGRLFIADDDNHRVVQETLDGAFLAQIGGFGTGPGQFRFPYDVAVDDRAPRQLYVADNNNHRIQSFDAASLAFVRTWGGFGPEPGRMEYIRALGALADDPSGGVGAADTANDRVQIFGAQGELLGAWGIAGRGPGYVTRPRGVAVDATGAVAVADTLDARVERFDADGTYAGQVGRVSPLSGFAAPGSAPGSLDGPAGVAFGTGGELWIADTANDRVVRVGPDGAWIDAATGFSAPAAVATAPDGAVLVADTGNDRIQRRDPSGAWTTLDLGDAALDAPGAVAAAPDGTVYVADATQVLELPAGGGAAVPLPAPEGRAWTSPGGLAADADRLVVADDTPGDAAVVARPRAGGAWVRLAGDGPGPGEVITPGGVALGPRDGAVLVADTGNDRVVRLGAAAPAMQALTVTAGPLEGGTVTSAPAGIACPTDCVQRYGEGRGVTLAPTPAPGWRFAGWSGACAGAEGCAVRLDAPVAVAATFAPVPGAGGPAAPPPVLPTTPTSPGTPPPPRDLVAPRLAAVGLAPRALRRGTRARLRFTLSEAATLTLRVQAARPGRRRAGACVAPGRAARHAPACRRWAVLPGRRVARARAGRGALVLTRRGVGRTLPAGAYRLVLVARDAAGNAAPARTVTFRVAR